MTNTRTRESLKSLRSRVTRKLRFGKSKNEVRERETDLDSKAKARCRSIEGILKEKGKTFFTAEFGVVRGGR